MTGGPSYPEAPDEAPMSVDDDEAGPSVEGHLTRADVDELGESQPLHLSHAPHFPQVPIQPNPLDTTTSHAQPLNPESP